MPGRLAFYDHLQGLCGTRERLHQRAGPLTRTAAEDTSRPALGRSQQGIEGAQFPGTEVIQVARVELDNQRVNGLEQLQALIGDLRPDNPAIRSFAVATNEPARCVRDQVSERDDIKGAMLGGGLEGGPQSGLSRDPLDPSVPVL
jgi:hypothetical protein